MKRIIFLLLPILFISCSKEEDPKPSFSTQSYTAEIGDLITLKGNNLGSVTSVNIFSEEYNVPGFIIVEESRGTYKQPSFTGQTETEIQFILPEVYADSYIIRVGDQDLQLNIKGFIPMKNDLDFERERLTGVKVIDENKALVTADRTLYLLENGYHDKKLISREVHFFDVLENGDSWYARSSDAEFYEIYYNAAGSPSYNLLTNFNRRDLNDHGGYFYPYNIFITPEKQIFISSGNGTFVIQNNEIMNVINIYPGLEAYTPEEREIYSFRLTPAGTVYGQLSYGNGYLNLNPMDNTFEFSEEFSSDVRGPIFRDNIGYLFLPWENRFYKSIDSGLTWIESSTLTPNTGEELRGAEMNVIDSNTVLLFLHTSKDSSFPYTTAYITRDGGNNWQEKKRFNAPRQIELSVHESDLNKHGGLIFFWKFTSYQLYKYVR